MKLIKIFHENQLVELLDDNNDDLVIYTKSLSSLLDLSNITILKTSSGCLIIRPHKVNSIFVTDVKNNSKINTNKKKNILNNIEVISNKKEESEDAISD